MSNFRLNPETGLQYEPSAQDYPNRVVVSASYELPFRKTKMFGANAGRLVNSLIAGWVVNSISTYQSGAPLAWGNVIHLGGLLNLNASNPHQTFNPAAFDRNSSDALANNVRTFLEYFSNLRANSYVNEDFSVLKNNHLTERLRLQLRFEFFNLFNHPVFSAPNLTPTASAFGTITGGATNQARQIRIGGRIVW